mgnify:CR=1 FL=1
MSEMPLNVLFLCTGNSARSVLAEAYLNAVGGKRFQAFSAGSHPKGAVHPITLDTLRLTHLPIEGLRSKSWDEFAGPGAPAMRIVITVCDSAAKETCPYWPGSPVKVHWGYPDPSNAPGGDEGRRQAFELTRQAIGYRMLQLVQLPFASLDDRQLQAALADIHAR